MSLLPSQPIPNHLLPDIFLIIQCLRADAQKPKLSTHFAYQTETLHVSVGVSPFQKVQKG